MTRLYLVSELQMLRREVPGGVEDDVVSVCPEDAVIIVFSAKTYHLLMVVISTHNLMYIFKKKKKKKVKFNTMNTQNLIVSTHNLM